MRCVNKTRYAILGMLLERPCTGYEIKTLMERSTRYFWLESDSTIYPMLKILEDEEKALSKISYVGNKKKEIFTITDLGKDEFNEWIKSPTGLETSRNEFLLKLFFLTNQKDMKRLFKERLKKMENIYEEYKKIEERLMDFANSNQKKMRLKALSYGLTRIETEIKWLKKGLK